MRFENNCPEQIIAFYLFSCCTQTVFFSFFITKQPKISLKMENRSLALRHLSEAVNMDSNGFQQAAFVKYLQSLQVLTLYLNEMLVSLGFQKMLEKKREVKQVLCMIHECSDRVSLIIDKDKNASPKLAPRTENNKVINSPMEKACPRKPPAIGRLHNENVLLIKRYQWRFEKTNDKTARANLRLELERQLVENDILAKKKYDIAVKKLQKERVQMMEKEMRKLLENRGHLSEKQKEKQELYFSVLQYTKTETWPCTWTLNKQEMSTPEAAAKIFQKTVKCSEHPLSQWLILVHTNIKREIDTMLKKYSEYQAMLPEQAFNAEDCIDFKESPDEFSINSPRTGNISISSKCEITLQKFLDNISPEIMNTIGNILEIFYLIYKSLLPEDSEEVCHKLIEAYILDPIWPNLITLFRLSNLPSEYKVLQTMIIHRDSTPESFGFSSKDCIDSSVFQTCILLLKAATKSRSMSEKLKIFVNISQTICGTPSTGQSRQKIFGADELMPILCYVVTKSKLPELSSECCAIEHLFDMNYMFGEEGYALSTFLTAVKYIEIRKLIDDETGECSSMNERK